MEPHARLHLEQGLKQSITPEMHQSIHMLQLSNSDLTDYLYEQANENPLLDVEKYNYASTNKINKIRTIGLQNEGDSMLRIPAREHTLEESLVSQLRLNHLDETVYRVAAYMAGNLDDSGYLDVSMEEIRDNLQCDEETACEALRQLHKLEPAGVGARNLSECLLIQLDRDLAAPVEAKLIVSKHLKALAQGRTDRIAAELNLTHDKVKAAAAFIRRLNPKPGLSLTPHRNTYIVPDARIDRESDGFSIHFMKGLLPKITINNEYVKLAEDIHCQTTAIYLKEMSRSASAILRSLEHREHTLFRVIHSILQEQGEFMNVGVVGLKSLKLKQIADKLKLHESTVCRAVMNKFVETPWGVLSLKSFFSTGLQTWDGEAASSNTVKAKIRQLIDTENKIKPISDQKIADVFIQNGIQLSRRTVTKYREEMHILSSTLRKTI